VALALKVVAQKDAKAWLDIRPVLWAAGDGLEPPMQTSFLTVSLAEKINARWDEDREVLFQRYGVHFDEAPAFVPGPEVLSFSADYATALQEAAAPDLSPSQRDLLAQALKFAGQDLEQIARRRLSGQISSETKTVSNPKTSKKGDVIMTEDTKTKPAIAREDAMALARAIFRVQNRKSDADAESDDKPSFKDAKREMLPLARRTLKILHNQGYSLIKT